jgi:hypothetical protein
LPDPRRESLDGIVSPSAVVLADQIQKAAAWAKSEMDLQVEVAGALKEFARRAKITLDVHHNITIATAAGRPDSVYSNVIVEYKDPWMVVRKYPMWFYSILRFEIFISAGSASIG